MTARRGSVLIMALWIIAILSVMVISFAFEARQQAGIDVYVRERNRVRRLIDSGRVLGEVVLLGYKDAPEPEIERGAPKWDDAFEDDRWVVEKYALKNDHKCTIGPIRMDETDPDEEDEDAPTVTVELKFESATSKIDINSLKDDPAQQRNRQRAGGRGGGCRQVRTQAPQPHQPSGGVVERLA